ncbi:MAG: DNA polymerase IV, partial [Acidobacteriota bacterium]
AKVLRDLGVHKATDLLRHPMSFWTKRLGKHAARLYEMAQGIDHSPVVPYSEPKSCSSEDTFAEDTADIEEIKKWMLIQAENVGRDLRREGCRGKTVTLKVKYADFRLVTRSRTLREPTDCTRIVFSTAEQLLDEMGLTEKIRLVGVGVSNLLAAGSMRQAVIFGGSSPAREEKLDRAMDEIRERFGTAALKRGRVLDFET